MTIDLRDLMGHDISKIPTRYRNQRTICKCKTVPIKNKSRQKLSRKENKSIKMDPEIEKLLQNFIPNNRPKSIKVKKTPRKIRIVMKKTKTPTQK